MFERFTDQARQVVILAEEEARLLNHDYIGTEHILLGLIHEGDGVAAKALQPLGISLEAVRQQVKEITGQGQQPPSGHIRYTPRAKKILELSLREALQLGHNFIGTEHLLLGLIHEGGGVAAQALVKLGADLSRVRQQVIQLLPGYQRKEEPETVRTPAQVRAQVPSPRGNAVSERSLIDALTSIGKRLTAIEQRLGIPGQARQEARLADDKTTGPPAVIPATGPPAVIPYLLYADAGAAMDWLVKTFGFTAAARDTRADGTVRHGELQPDGGGIIMLGSAGPGFRGPRQLGGVTQLVRITVTDLKAHRDRTKAAFAVAAEIQDGPPGWRSYSVHDPEGHEWYFTQFTDENG